ncbi:ice-binding family protein [Massilia sp. CF038]|uniref:ice-binding family protein n=1 Tax=Massilia sp. CF038 TaxID=1881045 RepID=UPI0009246873|nr:ice-binding family protein [Massilia sp. CF038]SHG49585.1 Ig-like domain (group 2) [Massilia sp. CF038]
MNILKSSRTVMCAAGLLMSALLSACGGGGDGRDPILGVNAAEVASIAVTPATATLQVGATRQFTATATYTDGSARNVSASAAWTSTVPATATVTGGTGLASAIAPGSTQIGASFGGKAGTATLTVTLAPTLTAIAVTPATAAILVGGSQQYVATAIYSDNTNAVITGTVQWSSSSPAVAPVSPNGLATGLTLGDTIISATSGTISGNAVLTVAAILPLPVLPVVPAPGAVSLGAASNFAVLAGTALTNNSGGTTVIGGDIGSPSQTVDPVQLPGFVNYKSGAILANALNDLQVAITDANSRTCTVSSAAGIDLGGRVFAPGVYCYAGAISITGTFIMNGPGVYIFRTTSTLNSTANAVVAMAGGASASDVFWVPVGPTTLGANGAFKGSILGQSAAITVGDNTTMLTGRVLSAAAVTLQNNQISK